MEYNEINKSSSLITLLYPEAKFICVKHENYKDEFMNLLVNGKCSYYIDGYHDISDVKVLQIMPLSNSEVIVQYISNEDFLKYYPKESEEELEECYVRERIIRDICSSKSIIKGEEVSGSLGSISTLTKQLITDNEFFGDDYKLKLLSFLDIWEKRISEKHEIDYLISEGYLDQSIKNIFAEPLNTNPMVAANVYKLILNGLINETIEFCERDIKSNEEKHIKVKQ